MGPERSRGIEWPQPQRNLAQRAGKGECKNMNKVTPQDLFTVGAHLGHKSFKVHPRSRQYIYQIDSGTSIIDLFQTATELEKAKKVAYDLGKDDKVLLIVATKKQTKEMIAAVCVENDIPFLTNKWVGGFITNFSAISQNIKKLSTLQEERDGGEWSQFVKHERVELEKKLNRIANIYSGVAKLTKTPSALFIVDIKKEANAASEARKEHIQTIAIVDTNTNPDLVDFPIPANDDAISSVMFITKEIISAYVAGRSNIGKTVGEGLKPSPTKKEKKS